RHVHCGDAASRPFPTRRSSDLLDDGYVDGAVTQLNGHTPAGELRGGKYSIFEAGTRVPFLVSGPGVSKNKVSDALFSQVDLLARSEEHTSELQSRENLVCRLLL